MSITFGSPGTPPPIPVIMGAPQYTMLVPNTGNALALTVPTGATHALVTNDSLDGILRWTYGSPNPTATTGHIIQAGTTVELDNITMLRFFANKTNVYMQVSYRHY